MARIVILRRNLSILPSDKHQGYQLLGYFQNPVWFGSVFPIWVFGLGQKISIDLGIWFGSKIFNDLGYRLGPEFAFMILEIDKNGYTKIFSIPVMLQ